MANILFIHSGLTGITNACIAFAKLLEVEGHKVFTASINDNQDKLNANQLKILQIQPIVFDYQILPHVDFKELLKNLDFDTFENQLKQNSIDLVLIDIEMHEYILKLYQLKFPFILITQWFSIWETNSNLPIKSTQRFNSKFRTWLSWRIANGLGILKVLAKEIKTKRKNRRQFINYLSNNFNFDRSKFESYSFPLPYFYSELPIISMTHPALEFTKAKPDFLHYGYPMVDENRIDSFTEAQDLFKNIFDVKIKENKKLIVITRTTMSNDKSNILEDLINVFNLLENTLVIISAGKNVDKLKKVECAPHIHVFDEIPQIDCLRHADLSINHGGIHTINECIFFEVPMLVISGQRFDQNGCAARIDYHECGISISEDKVSGEFLQYSIKELLETDKYQLNVSRLKEQLNVFRQSKTIEKYISGILA